MKLRKTIAMSAVAVLLLAGCSSSGSDDDAAPADKGTSDIPVEDVKDGEAPEPDGESDDGPEMPVAPAAGVKSATVVMNGETVELSGGGCSLEPQDSAGGGGQILFTGQATGQNGDGDEVFLDVSRFDEDSMFEGDMIDLVIGDYRTDDHKSFSLGLMGAMGGEKEFHLSLDGSTISANDVELIEDEMVDEMTVSLEINC
ncbi:MAG: hypothetical protein ABI239_02755 [Aquihabitans sp.]